MGAFMWTGAGEMAAMYTEVGKSQHSHPHGKSSGFVAIFPKTLSKGDLGKTREKPVETWETYKCSTNHAVGKQKSDLLPLGCQATFGNW